MAWYWITHFHAQQAFIHIYHDSQPLPFSLYFSFHISSTNLCFVSVFYHFLNYIEKNYNEILKSKNFPHFCRIFDAILFVQQSNLFLIFNSFLFTSFILFWFESGCVRMHTKKVQYGCAFDPGESVSCVLPAISQYLTASLMRF